MKKLFFTLALVATSVAAMAQRWTAPTSQTYPDETPLYVTVEIDDLADTYVPEVSEIAAFIDGECRAQATAMTDGRYTLRVRGKLAEDIGKTITIKALYHGLVYTLSTSEKFDGEAEAHAVPLALKLEPMLGIGLVEDPIEMTLGGDTYNLAEKLVYSYGRKAGSSVSCSPLDLTETPLTVTYQWDPKSEPGYIEVSNEGIITALAVTNQVEANAMVTVSAAEDEYKYTPYFETRARVNVSLPTVTGINVNKTELDVYVGDNLQTLIREGKLTISFTPANANQAYGWRTNEESFPWDGNYMFTTEGTYQVEVYSVDNTNVAAAVTFHVTLPPVTEIVVRPTTVDVTAGESLDDIIRNQRLTIQILPVYAEQGYKWKQDGQNPLPWNEQTEVFESAGTYTAQVYSVGNPNVTATVTFNVTLPAVTQIVVRPTTVDVTVGESLDDIIGRLSIKMLPEYSDQSYDWKQDGQNPLPWNAQTKIFESAGTYTAQVYSIDYPNVTETVTFNVALPAVTQIVVEPKTVNVYVGENLNEVIDAGRLSIKMLPAEADQSYRWLPVEQNLPWNGNNIFESAGTYYANVVSTANRDLQPVTVTFIVSEPLTLQVGDEANGGKIGMITPLEFPVYMTTSEGFDANLLTVEARSKFPIAPFTYKVGNVQQEANAPTGGAGRYYVTVSMAGRYLGSVYFNVLYNGNIINEAGALQATVCPEISINEGWQWVSPYAYEAGSEAGDIYANSKWVDWVNNLVEMRTQEGLLYNDKTLGIFGDINQFNFTEGMYKVKVKEGTAATVLRLGSDEQSWQLARGNTQYVDYGYNWVVYPFEFNLGLNEVGGLGSAHEGDQIIAYGGTFAEYSNDVWIPADFTFQAGAGYMYYSRSTETGIFEPTFNTAETIPACYQPQANPVRGDAFGATKTIAPVWKVEQGRFADVMTIVAEIPGLTDADAWTIGAFVDGECRGLGRIVKDDILFIGLMGKSGEKISFRLHNNFTGEEFDVSEALSFRQKAGSLKAPLRLTSEGATGIVNVDAKENLGDKAIYDLSGRRVERPAKGIYVRNGKKVLF